MTEDTPQPSQPRPERVETDSSLRAERDKADEELRKRSAALDEDADQVIELARERADELVDSQRLEADALSARSIDSYAAAERLAIARASADEAVSEERAAADEKLAVERGDHDLAMRLLLALEREETDERLLAERTGSDRAVASRDEFLGMVSHDVREILGAIAMSAELLLRILPAAGPDRVAHGEAGRIRRLTGRMSRLVGDLLDVVSLEAGTLNIMARLQDAAPLLAEAIESMRPAAAAMGIALRAEIATGVCAASFDHDRILQVLTNLVGNALKFTASGGEVVLLAAPIPSGIQITVRDRGCGIQPDKIESVFERFSQAHQRDRRGLGLGLYISRCIVEAHGGKIWAESELGKGSSFHFTLMCPG
jgi:signal transduction histidine kinase